MTLLLWLLTSLVSIALVGDYPYLALGTAILAGAVFAVSAYGNDRARFENLSQAQSIANPLRRLVARYGGSLDLAIVVLLVLPSRWMLLGLLLLPVTWVLRKWTRGRIFEQTPFDLPVLALLSMVLVSWWVSADWSITLVPVGQILAGVNLFYALAARLRTQTDIAWGIAGLIVVGVALALLAPFTVEWVKTKVFAVPFFYDNARQLLSDAIHPNLLAGALDLILPVSVAILLYAPLASSSAQKRMFARIGLALASILILVILILTQSRGGIAAAFIGLVILFLPRKRFVLALGLVSVMGMAVVWSRVDATHLADLFLSTDSVVGLSGRSEIWSRAIYVLQDVPFTGLGLGMFARAVQVIYPLFLLGPDADVHHAHNLYLQVGVDLGLPGLVAFIGLQVIGLLSAWHAWRSARRTGNADGQAIALGLGVALGVVILHGLVDSLVWDAKPAVFIWTLWALANVANRVQQTSEQPSIFAKV